MIGGERVKGTTKSGRARVVSIDDETVAVLRQRKAGCWAARSGQVAACPCACRS